MPPPQHFRSKDDSGGGNRVRFSTYRATNLCPTNQILPQIGGAPETRRAGSFQQLVRATGMRIVPAPGLA